MCDARVKVVPRRVKVERLSEALICNQNLIDKNQGVREFESNESRLETNFHLIKHRGKNHQRCRSNPGPYALAYSL